MQPISIQFIHGLGDAANYAHALKLWTSRGYPVNVNCTPDKAVLFQAAGCTTDPWHTVVHPYSHPGHIGTPHWCDDSRGNKLFHNLSQVLPSIGNPDELWCEMLQVRLTLEPFVTEQSKAEIDGFLADCYGPVILLHTRANTGSGQKNFQKELEFDAYKELVHKTGGTLVLLDWDNRVQKVANARVRHMRDDFRCLTLPELWYLYQRSALLIGVDSGPLHFSRFSDIPAIGIWRDHKAAHFALPRSRTLHLSPTKHGDWNYRRRHSYNLVSADVTAERIAALACKMLDTRGDAPSVAHGAFLEQLRQHNGQDLIQDRERTFGAVLNFIRERDNPVIVETGCMRSEEDYSAGMSSFLFGWALSIKGDGVLHSVDIDANNVKNCQAWTEPFGGHCSINCSDSVKWLWAYRERFEGKPIDVLYLDSLDVDSHGHAEHCVAEFEAAFPSLKPDALVLIDDTPRRGGKWSGKGALLVPKLLADGWKLVDAGYQVLLQKGNS